MADTAAASNLIDMAVGAGGGVTTTGIVGAILYKLLGNRQQEPPVVCPVAPVVDKLEDKMDDMVRAQQRSNELLSEIRGGLRGLRGNG